MTSIYTIQQNGKTLAVTEKGDYRTWTMDTANKIQECFENGTLKFKKGKRYFELISLRMYALDNSKIFAVNRDGITVGLWTNTNKFATSMYIKETEIARKHNELIDAYIKGELI